MKWSARILVILDTCENKHSVQFSWILQQRDTFDFKIANYHMWFCKKQPQTIEFDTATQSMVMDVAIESQLTLTFHRNQSHFSKETTKPFIC